MTLAYPTTTRPRPQWWLSLLCVSLLACGDDLPDPQLTGTGSSGTSGSSTTAIVPADTTTGGPPVTTSMDGTTSTTGPGPATSSGTTEASTGGSSSEGTAGPVDCDAIDLGMMVPHTEMGTTMGAGDDHVPSCAFRGGNGQDLFYTWTAPADGTYVFDTFGSEIDTILTVLTECMGAELACDDDTPDSFQSEVMLDLMANDSVLISVDSWKESGNVVLNIDILGGGSSSSDGGSTSGTTGGTSTTSGGTTGTSTTSGGTTGTSTTSGGTTGTSTTGGGSTTTGGGMAMGFDDCATLDPLDACIQPDEVCLLDDLTTPAFGACALQGCLAAEDCPPAPEGGTAMSICADLDGDAADLECALDCSAGQACPTGMSCYLGSVCMWPVLSL